MGISRFIPLLVAALLAVGTYWMAEFARLGAGPVKPNSPLNPDVVIEGVRMSRLNEQGTVQTLINAARLIHVPQSDVATLESPRILQSTAGRAPVTITADRAQSLQGGQEVLLESRVVLTREAAADQAALVIRTDRMAVRPDEELVTSDAPVKIEYGLSSMAGTGMRFSNLDRRLTIEHKAQGTIAPAGKK